MRQAIVTGQMIRFITDQPKAVKTVPEEKDESATVENDDIVEALDLVGLCRTIA